MLPRNSAQVPALFKQARELERQGKLKQAKKVYGEVLALAPGSAPARFQIGQIEYKLGNYEATTAALDKALKYAPREKTVWGLYVRALQQIGDEARNAAFLARAKKARLDRDFLISMQEALRTTRRGSITSTGSANPLEIHAAIELLQSGRPDEALERALAMRKKHPDVAIIADIAANALSALGRPDEAEAQFRDSVTLDPNYAESHVNFGRFLIERNRNREAIVQLRRAVAIAPKMHTAYSHLGQALSRQGLANEAAQAFRKALDLKPDSLHATMEFGRHLMKERALGESIELLRKAQEMGADEMDVRLCLSTALWFHGREQEALEEADAVLAKWPDCSPAYSAKASVYQSLGEFDKANEAFLAAIEHDPMHGENYRVFLISNKLKPDDPMIPKMEELFADPEIGDESRANLGFALAKALEDTKQYDRVFTYLRPANELMRKLYPFDIDTQRTRMESIKSRFRGVDLQAIDIPGRPDYAPIFITGLPRSGTTLVEQIVASHSTVTGGGELGYTRLEVHQAMMTRNRQPRAWTDLSDDEIVGMGERAVAKMRQQVPGAEKITDKGIEGYTLIGAIRAVLPNARIIVVRRDPRDNLLSIYKNMFVDGKHLYSYSLHDLGVMYRLFDDMVAFWRKQVPGWFHEIQYEELISDPEAQTRKLIAACDLDWEDACLAFHENKRRVDTLSVHQVRQPIYKSSMKAWQRYEDELGELFDALGGEYARKPAAE